MTLADFDDESNLLDIDDISRKPLQIKRIYLIIAILVLTATAAFALGVMAQQGASGAPAGVTVTSGSLKTSKGVPTGSSMTDLSVPPVPSQ
jgi:hypothetical protein